MTTKYSKSYDAAVAMLDLQQLHKGNRLAGHELQFLKFIDKVSRCIFQDGRQLS